MPITKRDFEITSGESATLKIDLTPPYDNYPISPKKYDKFYWELKRDYNSSSSILKKESSDIDKEYAHISLSSSDTEDLKGLYYHAGYIIDKDENKKPIFSGRLYAYNIDSIPDLLAKPHDYFEEKNVVRSYPFIYEDEIHILIDENIEPNKEYHVFLKNIKDKEGNIIEDYSFKFTTEYYPLHASYNILKTDLSDYVESINDNLIYSYIRENSRAIEKLSPRDDIDWNSPPFEVKQYVRYKTLYDIILFSHVNNGQTSEIRLADLDIKKEQGNIDALIERIKEQYKVWYDMVMGQNNRGMAQTKHTVKSKNNPNKEGYYPGKTRMPSTKSRKSEGRFRY